MSLISISEHISYLPSSYSPLSADVGIIRGEKHDWIFDVGSSDEASEAIANTGMKRNVILSHFHADHTSNLSRITFENLYCSKYTAAKQDFPTAILPPATISDGVTLTIFPLPSLHSKGSVGLGINGEYAFLGDSVYSGLKSGKAVYNINILQEMIDTLSSLREKYFLMSHASSFVQPKESVIAELSRLYDTRSPDEAYIIAK